MGSPTPSSWGESLVRQQHDTPGCSPPDRARCQPSYPPLSPPLRPSDRLTSVPQVQTCSLCPLSSLRSSSRCEGGDIPASRCPQLIGLLLGGGLICPDGCFHFSSSLLTRGYALAFARLVSFDGQASSCFQRRRPGGGNLHAGKGVAGTRLETLEVKQKVCVCLMSAGMGDEML